MENKIKEQILEAEENLRRAMKCSDVEALNQLIAPELLFTNHLGQLISKQQDIEAHASGALKINDITLAEQQILLVKAVVIVSARVRIEGSYNGDTANGDFRFTRVWSPSPTGAWHVIAGHSCIIA